MAQPRVNGDVVAGSGIHADYRPLSHYKLGAGEEGDCGSSPITIPSWLDLDKFNRGRKFFMDHMFSMVLAMHCSLAIGLSIINLLEPLVFTNKSDTPQKAFSRYLQTFLHLVLWHTGDVWNPKEEAHKSVQTVRKMHGHVAKQMSKKMPGKVFLSQYDMALVQSGFMGAVTMYPEGFGIKCSKRDLEDYIHFWRGIGYLLGIHDNYNMCYGHYQQTYNIGKEIETALLLPSLKNPPKDFSVMSEAYVKGTNIPSGFEFMSQDALVSFCLNGMKQPVKRLGVVDTLRFWILKLQVFLVRWCPGFERFINKVAMKNYQRWRGAHDLHGKKYF